MVFGKSRVISHFLQSQRLREVIVDVGQQTVELLIVIVALFRSIFRSCKKGVIVFPADGGQDIDQISVYGVFTEGDAGGKIERADFHKPGVNMLIDTGSRPFRQKTGIEQHGLQGTVIVEDNACERPASSYGDLSRTPWCYLKKRWFIDHLNKKGIPYDDLVVDDVTGVTFYESQKRTSQAYMRKLR